MSSGSESDEDYVPGVPEQVSEQESADEETDLQFEKELEHKSKKRKILQESKGKKKRKTRNRIKEKATSPKEENVNTPDEVTNPEEEKKREDDLWAKFLEGTDTKPKPVMTKDNSFANKLTAPTVGTSKDQPQTVLKKEDEKDRERRIFEFAGETIVVENNVIKEKVKTTTGSPTTASKLDGPSSRNRGPGGLSNLLDQINKKNKLSTLEKSKLDWETYKKDEGIEEEIQSHNKGKEGYLDRQDFLERADLRQYEIERNLRMNRRSNR